MKIVVVDGQGGGVGRALIERLKPRLASHTIIAVGTNALATSAMLRAGADAGATGENAVRFNCESADVLLGPSGFTTPNAMLGEVSPAMAEAVASARAKKFLLPMEPCEQRKPGAQTSSIAKAADALTEAAILFINAEEAKP